MIKEFFGTIKPISLVVSYLETTFQLGGKSSPYAGGGSEGVLNEGEML